MGPKADTDILMPQSKAGSNVSVSASALILSAIRTLCKLHHIPDAQPIDNKPYDWLNTGEKVFDYNKRSFKIEVTTNKKNRVAPIRRDSVTIIRQPPIALSSFLPVVEVG
jgi:hypothetical protein